MVLDLAMMDAGTLSDDHKSESFTKFDQNHQKKILHQTNLRERNNFRERKYYRERENKEKRF